MGGEHHSDEDKFIIPDYKIYKVEDCPELMTLKNRLAQKGLKDPWLRNHVWKYNKEEWGTLNYRKRMCFFRGFTYGFAFFLVTLAGEALYDSMYPTPEHNHGHH